MAATEKPRVLWTFIHSASADLAWYIGPSLAGWLYVGLVLLLGRGLQDPFQVGLRRRGLIHVTGDGP